MTLGVEIRESRRRSRKTLRQVASEAVITAGLLSLIERDKYKPSPEIITRLARALGGDTDQWCGLAGTISPDAKERLARIAAEKPRFFRQLLERTGGSS